jgi:hypothetical protein
MSKTLAGVIHLSHSQPTYCQGSRQWPKYSQSTNVFFCGDCGHVFERNQLQGRDDHMPAHFDLMAIARAQS